MKILVDVSNNKVKHYVSDAGMMFHMGAFLTMVMEAGERPLQVPQFHEDNSLIFEDVTLPVDDIINDKYTYDGAVFAIAPDWVEPQPKTTEEID